MARQVNAFTHVVLLLAPTVSHGWGVCQKVHTGALFLMMQCVCFRNHLIHVLSFSVSRYRCTVQPFVRNCNLCPLSRAGIMVFGLSDPSRNISNARITNNIFVRNGAQQTSDDRGEIAFMERTCNVCATHVKLSMWHSCLLCD